jgi:hypothetical protein
LSLLLAAGLILAGSAPEAAARAHHHAHHHARVYRAHHHHHHSKVRKVASIAAPIAIGAAFGPAGSVSYQAVKHRKAIKRHLFHHRG